MVKLRDRVKRRESRGKFNDREGKVYEKDFFKEARSLKKLFEDQRKAEKETGYLLGEIDSFVNEHYWALQRACVSKERSLGRVEGECFASQNMDKICLYQWFRRGGEDIKYGCLYGLEHSFKEPVFEPKQKSG